MFYFTPFLIVFCNFSYRKVLEVLATILTFSIYAGKEVWGTNRDQLMKWGFIYLYCGSNRNNSKRNCTMHCNAKTVDSSIICAPNELLKIIWFWWNNLSLLWVHIIWQFQMINQHFPIQLNFIHCCQVIIETQWLLGSLYWSLVIGSVVKWPLWRSFQISRKHFVYLPQQPAMQTNPLRPARASESLCITFSLTFCILLISWPFTGDVNCTHTLPQNGERIKANLLQTSKYLFRHRYSAHVPILVKGLLKIA